MKKLTILLLLMVTTSVFAEWTKVTSSKGGENTFYIDFETIKRKGHKVKVWHLFDYKTVQTYEKIKFLSQLTRNEYDCEEETKRMLDFYWYSGNMKNGEVVYSRTNIKNEPESIVPESISEALFNIACDKK